MERKTAPVPAPNLLTIKINCFLLRLFSDHKQLISCSLQGRSIDLANWQLGQSCYSRRAPVFGRVFVVVSCATVWSAATLRRTKLDRRKLLAHATNFSKLHLPPPNLAVAAATYIIDECASVYLAHNCSGCDCKCISGGRRRLRSTH